LYCDGRGLWLNIGPTAPDSPDPLTAKSWLFRYQLRGKSHAMGLGALHTVGLAEARQRAQAARHLCLDGIDPLEAKRARKAQIALEAAKAITFRDCAARYIEAHRAAWRSVKHAGQWDVTLARFVYPTIGNLPVAAVDTGHVTQILQPIWVSKSETASRLRGRIEAVLDFAKTHGWREGSNPARWRGHLENVLPKRSKVRRVKHHAALPWREIGSFMERLTQQKGMAALALRFAILTAARTGEVIGARWSEIDLERGLWVVPESRMKSGKEHRVPLSGAALDVLLAAMPMRNYRTDGFVFPGGKAGAPLSNMAMLVLLRRMGRPDITTHGFRSCLKDWASETGKSPDLSEAALAHVVGNKVVAAYQRGDLLERRRQLMNQWAAFCARPVMGEVIELHATVA
jgi:integrase